VIILCLLVAVALLWCARLSFDAYDSIGAVLLVLLAVSIGVMGITV
jgi:hypothetical protein